MSKTIKQLLECILTDKIESYTRFKNNLEPDRKEYKDSILVLEERISAMNHVIEILNDRSSWLHHLEKLGLKIEEEKSKSLFDLIKK